MSNDQVKPTIQELVVMQGPLPRKVYPSERVQQPVPDTRICRYLSLEKFEWMVKDQAIFMARLDAFHDDPLEGRLPRDVWELQCEPLKRWYEANRSEIYASCWYCDDRESLFMWQTYAKGRGVMICSTVERLINELSIPALPEPPALTPQQQDIAAYANSIGAKVTIGEPPVHDGFTVGIVEYFDHDQADVYEMLKQQAGLDNTTPMFRKQTSFSNEREFRAILRPGSFTAIHAKQNNLHGVNITVDLERLVQEIRYYPSDDLGLVAQIRGMLPEAIHHRLFASALTESA